MFAYNPKFMIVNEKESTSDLSNVEMGQIDP